MRLHIAGSGHHSIWIDSDFFDFYRLESFFYISKKEIPYIHRYKGFMLDSGAFSTFSGKPSNVDWDSYVKNYANFIKNNNIKLFFELDIDKVVGLRKVEDYRKMLEDVTGRQPIPVWHPNRGSDYFLKMCEDYSYVAIGTTNSTSAGRKMRKNQHVFTWFINNAHKRGAKIHGLGFTDCKGLKLYKFDSVDSTTWLSGSRFGNLFLFTGNDIISHKKESNKRGIGKKLSYHNFYEWIKFQKYAEKNL